jgi:hypothetical protein
MIEIEPADEKASGRCACCGKAKRTAWGFVYEDGGPRACYFVEWAVAHAEKSARFDVVVGRWSDDARPDERSAVSYMYRAGDFQLADATGRPAAEAGVATTKAEVAGTKLADEALAIARAVLEADDRFKELT